MCSISDTELKSKCEIYRIGSLLRGIKITANELTTLYLPTFAHKSVIATIATALIINCSARMWFDTWLQNWRYGLRQCGESDLGTKPCHNSRSTLLLIRHSRKYMILKRRQHRRLYFDFNALLWQFCSDFRAASAGDISIYAWVKVIRILLTHMCLKRDRRMVYRSPGCRL